jgi:hypothetical protein
MKTSRLIPDNKVNDFFTIPDYSDIMEVGYNQVLDHPFVEVEIDLSTSHLATPFHGVRQLLVRHWNVISLASDVHPYPWGGVS